MPSDQDSFVTVLRDSSSNSSRRRTVLRESYLFIFHLWQFREMWVLTHPGKGPSCERPVCLPYIPFLSKPLFRSFYLQSHVLRKSYMPSSFSSPQSVFGLSPDLDDLSISNGLHSLSTTEARFPPRLHPTPPTEWLQFVSPPLMVRI